MARERAWRDIAAERRRNGEERRRLQRQHEAIEHCRNCPFVTHQKEGRRLP